jgi:hypothetical protein
MLFLLAAATAARFSPSLAMTLLREIRGRRSGRAIPLLVVFVAIFGLGAGVGLAGAGTGATGMFA